MKTDPMNNVTVTAALRFPPSSGPGSGKAAWVEYAVVSQNNCAALWDIVDRQSEVIRELQAEIGLLRNQIAKRKPKGGRPATPDNKVAAIEADIARGLSRRAVAARHGVSAMTVTRVAQRIAARASAA